MQRRAVEDELHAGIEHGGEVALHDRRAPLEVDVDDRAGAELAQPPEGLADAQLGGQRFERLLRRQGKHYAAHRNALAAAGLDGHRSPVGQLNALHALGEPRLRAGFAGAGQRGVGDLAQPAPKEADVGGAGLAQKPGAADLERLRRADVGRLVVAGGQDDQVPEALDHARRLAVLAQPIGEGAAVQLAAAALVDAAHGEHGGPDPRAFEQAEVSVAEDRPGEMPGRGQRRPKRGDAAGAAAAGIDHAHVQRALVAHRPAHPNSGEEGVERGAAAHRDVLAVVERHAVLRIDK